MIQFWYDPPIWVLFVINSIYDIEMFSWIYMDRIFWCWLRYYSSDRVQGLLCSIPTTIPGIDLSGYRMLPWSHLSTPESEPSSSLTLLGLAKTVCVVLNLFHKNKWKKRLDKIKMAIKWILVSFGWWVKKLYSCFRHSLSFIIYLTFSILER